MYEESRIRHLNVAQNPRALLSALSQAQLRALPSKLVCFGLRLTCGGARIIAQSSIASQVTGTMQALARKSHRIR